MIGSVGVPNEYRYDVALSFAGEDRKYVVQVAEYLKTKGVRVFYDEFERVSLWGKDLTETFVDVYMKNSRYAVLFISEHYRDKVWTRLERRAALARDLTEHPDYLLPARFDDTEIEGLLPTKRYEDLQRTSPTELGVLICEKIGHDIRRIKANQLPSSRSRASEGEVTFDYSSFDGRFRIGDGAYLFETSWSKASDTTIYCYNDPPSIRGIALAPQGSKMNEIVDASILDFSSRARSPEEGRVVVFENANGFYAAVDVLDIKDDSRSDDRDELTFRYWILTDGTKDFSTATIT